MNEVEMIKEIEANPADNSLKLIYADWLEENESTPGWNLFTAIGIRWAVAKQKWPASVTYTESGNYMWSYHPKKYNSNTFELPIYIYNTLKAKPDHRNKYYSTLKHALTQLGDAIQQLRDELSA